MTIAGVANLSPLGNTAVGVTKTVENIGNDGNFSWITFENRLTISVGIQPSYYGSSGGMPMGFTCPPLTRVTLPIDPGQDVYVSCQYPQLTNKNLQVNNKQYVYPLPTIGLGQQTARAANCPYMLHDDGAPAMIPLYPPSSWIPSVIGDVSPIQANTNSRAAVSYVGLPLTATGQFTQEQYLGGGNQDTVIMAVSYTLKDAVVPAGMLITFRTFAWYGSGASPFGSMISEMVLFGPGDPIGTVMTILTHGAQFVQTRFQGFAGTELVNIAGVAWLGVPAN